MPSKTTRRDLAMSRGPRGQGAVTAALFLRTRAAARYQDLSILAKPQGLQDFKVVNEVLLESVMELIHCPEALGS